MSDGTPKPMETGGAQRPPGDGGEAPPREIRVHIDHLVLDPAFAHLDRQALGGAVEAELARLLTEEGPPPRLGERTRRDRVSGGRFDLDGRPGLEAVARQVARGVHRGMGR